MVKKKLENAINNAFSEICKNNPDMNVEQPFSISIYDPNLGKMYGYSTTRTTLKVAITALFHCLEMNPGYTGEIWKYRKSKSFRVFKHTS